MSKKNGRIYECFYKSDYEKNMYSIKPLNPTESESMIYPFPHLRIEYNSDDWEEVTEETLKNQPKATIDEIECLSASYLVKNDCL